MRKSINLLKSYKSNKLVKYSLLVSCLLMICSLFVPLLWNPFYLVNQATTGLLVGDFGSFIFYLFLLNWILKHFFDFKIMKFNFNKIWLIIVFSLLPLLALSFNFGFKTSMFEYTGIEVFQTSWLDTWIQRWHSFGWGEENLMFSLSQSGAIYTTLFLVTLGELGGIYSIILTSTLFSIAFFFTFFEKKISFKYPFKNSISKASFNTENLQTLSLDSIRTREFKIQPDITKTNPKVIDRLDPSNPKDLELINIFKKIEQTKNNDLKINPNLSKSMSNEKERLQSLKDKLIKERNELTGKDVELILNKEDEANILRKKNILEKGRLSPVLGFLDKEEKNKTEQKEEIKIDKNISFQEEISFESSNETTIERLLSNELITIYETSEFLPEIEDLHETEFSKNLEMDLALSITETTSQAIEKVNITIEEFSKNLIPDNNDTLEKELEFDSTENDFQELTKNQSTKKDDFEYDEKFIETVEEIKKVENKVTLKQPDEEKLERKLSWCRGFSLPKTNLLDQQKEILNTSNLMLEANTKSAIINHLFENFGVKAKVISFQIGPTVTTYEIELDQKTLTSKITNLEDNIKLSLEAKDIRIQAPIPGKSVVGIEVPNNSRKTVYFQEVFNQQRGNEFGEILLTIGQDVVGKVFSFDLTKTPHLLVAGTTGSGKSTVINSIIGSILMRYKPQDVSLLLVDPKIVEFVPYHNIPHLITPVITSPQNASLALKAVVNEMEERYKMMANYSVRNISDLNKKLLAEGKQKIPYIVVIIDELADLMLVAAKEVEDSILRITQKARAAGIHAILATQRPSVNVITGVIKANIPSRIAFAVSSSIDSRTILDRTGAEKLIGLGDMLVSFSGQIPQRGQGCYISDGEIERLTNHTKKQCSPSYLISLEKIEESALPGVVLVSQDDPMYKEARKLAIQHRKISTSMLQRYLQIGYNNAANLIDALERNGVIGPALGGNKPREVLIEE